MPSPEERADDMDLPAGKTCGVCDNFRRCVGLFGCEAGATRCDWSPSRFRESMTETKVQERIRTAVLTERARCAGIAKAHVLHRDSDVHRTCGEVIAAEIERG